MTKLSFTSKAHKTRPHKDLTRYHNPLSVSARDDCHCSISGKRKHLHFYTDGSNSNGKCAFELHCKEIGLHFAHRLPDTCSANKNICRNIETNMWVIIYADSQAAIRYLETMSLNSQTVLDRSRSLNEMTVRFNISVLQKLEILGLASFWSFTDLARTDISFIEKYLYHSH